MQHSVCDAMRYYFLSRYSLKLRGHHYPHVICTSLLSAPMSAFEGILELHSVEQYAFESGEQPTCNLPAWLALFGFEPLPDSAGHLRFEPGVLLRVLIRVVVQPLQT